MGADIAVIGGGAAGMMAAIAAASGGCHVSLYEKNDRVGKKILSTGNGKCNLSNRQLDISCYYTSHPLVVEAVLESFTVADTVAFFRKAGLVIRDKNGYLYPAAEQASVVLDILRQELVRQRVRVCCDSEVTEVHGRNPFGFHVTAGDQQRIFDKVILACGSRASLKKGEGQGGYRLAESLHHRVIQLMPALVQLRIREAYGKIWGGVRCQARVTLSVDGVLRQKEEGELQLTEYGISGIPVFQFSREAAYALSAHREVTVEIDFFPDDDERGYDAWIRERLENRPDQTLEECLLGMVHKKINQVMIKESGCKGSDRVVGIGEKKIREILWAYKRFPVHIAAANSFEQAQVCAGGVSLHELSGHLESLKTPGLYFAGEMVDVDGKCGGYNLQWAWSSGYVTGTHASKRREATSKVRKYRT